MANYLRLDSSGRNRWGDYSARQVDPTDPTRFWTVQEFASSTNEWQMRVTELRFTAVPEPSTVVLLAGGAGVAAWARLREGPRCLVGLWANGDTRTGREAVAARARLSPVLLSGGIPSCTNPPPRPSPRRPRRRFCPRRGSRHGASPTCPTPVRWACGTGGRSSAPASSCAASRWPAGSGSSAPTSPPGTAAD
ncbi:MAG: PEP-CTERM sorting domain-containing protein [Planctomycetia bacterium]|nr:PEP-CTERM sorting domain-containing protein [Planctomycetia bacterium]